MAPHTSAVMTMSRQTGPDQVPVSPCLPSAEPPQAARRGRPRPLEAARCSLCGVALPLGLLVPDGGQACADIRWYCKDALSCTGRWTTARPPGRAHTPAVPGGAAADAGEAAADAAPAQRPGGTAGEAESAA